MGSSRARDAAALHLLVPLDVDPRVALPHDDGGYGWFTLARYGISLAVMLPGHLLRRNDPPAPHEAAHGVGSGRASDRARLRREHARLHPRSGRRRPRAAPVAGPQGAADRRRLDRRRSRDRAARVRRGARPNERGGWIARRGRRDGRSRRAHAVRAAGPPPAHERRLSVRPARRSLRRDRVLSARQDRLGEPRTLRGEREPHAVDERQGGRLASHALARAGRETAADRFELDEPTQALSAILPLAFAPWATERRRDRSGLGNDVALPARQPDAPKRRDDRDRTGNDPGVPCDSFPRTAACSRIRARVS